MKKNLQKIFASASVVVAVILIMVLLVTAFGGIKTEEFQTNLVKGLLITLSIIYIILAILTLILAFISSDVVKEITIRSEQSGSVRITVGVVHKFVKNACAEIEGVKCQKVSLVTDEYGVRLKVAIKVVDKDVLETETYLRTLLEDLFKGEFGFRFHSIEIKVIQLAPKYKANQGEINAKVAKKLEEMKQNDTPEAAVEAPIEEETPAVVESTEDVAPAVEETVAEVIDETSQEEAIEEAVEEPIDDTVVEEEPVKNEDEE